MLRFRDISIRNKLVLMQVCTSFLVLGIFFVVFIISDVRTYKDRKVDSLLSLAQVIGTNAISTLQFEDSESATAILSELRTSSTDIIHAGINDKKGKLFASYKKTGSANFIIPPSYMFRQFAFSGHWLFVSSDIVYGDKVIGKIFLVAELTELEKIIESKYRTAAILLVVALAFSFLVAAIMQTYISRRLLKLVGTMKEVGRTGFYNKSIKDDGKDEISTLVQVFNQLMQKVEENQQRKDEFIGIASHELKTPLTTIKGYLELLKDMEDRPTNAQFVDKALKNVNKLEKLIRDLLDVSKIQGGQLELNWKEFDMNSLLDESIASVQMISNSHKIVRINAEKPVMLVADRQRIEQVLFNLLSNAIKYSPGENKVLVTAQTNDADMIVCIRDYGMGIPQEEQTFIFERFYRTKDTSVHISGFGLGLYICRDIIHRHNGKIWVQTEDKGSSFCFSLPLQQPGVIAEPNKNSDL